VTDRIVQTVVAMWVEPEAERVFHPDSYGYRPRRSAVQAVDVCRRRCWDSAWVVDLDIRAFFDTVPHDLVLRAVQRHTTQRWVMLYVKRWLKAPLQHPDGQLEQRDRGTPQGSAISPLLANLFMHYAFDVWMSRTYAQVRFERYCDDAVIHCATETQARQIRDALAARFTEVGLELHPDKTKIVYCPQDGRRKERPGDIVEFTFLGFTFCQRTIRTKHGQIMLGFVPAISRQAIKTIGRTIRWWRLGRCTALDIHQIARWINPIVAGWINYYGRFYKSLVLVLLRRINKHLERWARRKYKRLRARPVETRQRIRQFAETHRGLFIHWRHGALPD
jgi:RNA-directed DNA polymerase